MNVLVDHNLKGYIVLLRGTLAADGWLDLLSIGFVTLEVANLAIDTSDRIIWCFAQTIVEREYREQCCSRMADIILCRDDYLGTGRLSIP